MPPPPPPPPPDDDKEGDARASAAAALRARFARSLARENAPEYEGTDRRRRQAPRSRSPRPEDGHGRPRRTPRPADAERLTPRRRPTDDDDDEGAAPPRRGTPPRRDGSPRNDGERTPPRRRREAADDDRLTPRRRDRRPANEAGADDDDDRGRRRRDDGRRTDAADGGGSPGRSRSPAALETAEKGRRHRTAADGERRSRSPATVGARLDDALARGLGKGPAPGGAAARAPAVFDGRAIPFVLRKLHAFAAGPAPGGGDKVVRCFIERTRTGAHALFPLYKLYADHEDGTGRLLLAARKVPSASPHYVVSTATSDVYKARARRSRHYLGKLRATTPGEYVLYDAGGRAGDGKALRRELAAVVFGGPTRRFEVALPRARWRARGPREADAEALDPGIATVHEFQPAEPAAGLRHAFDVVRGRGAQNVLDADSVYVAHARTSKYDPLSSCLVDFRARASVASVKNFQLVASAPAEPHERRAYYARAGEGHGLAADDAALPVVLQMGKVGKDCFNMDYTYPFSLLQAFAVCLARFDTGLAAGP